MNFEQRKKLTKIIGIEEGNNWWKSDLFMEETKALISNELEILENPPTYENNYDCR
jgi:hypothetical protein